MLLRTRSPVISAFCTIAEAICSKTVALSQPRSNANPPTSLTHRNPTLQTYAFQSKTVLFLQKQLRCLSTSPILLTRLNLNPNSNPHKRKPNTRTGPASHCAAAGVTSLFPAFPAFAARLAARLPWLFCPSASAPSAAASGFDSEGGGLMGLGFPAHSSLRGRMKACMICGEKALVAAQYDGAGRK
jgi:hypothetical protein